MMIFREYAKSVFGQLSIGIRYADSYALFQTSLDGETL